MRSLKKILQDNLSLSSKLFLRGLIATVARIIRTPAAVLQRGRAVAFGRLGLSSPHVLRSDPRLRQKLPNIPLDIIGDNPSAAIAAYNSEDVRIRGYVPDAEPYLRDRRVFIAPLRFGAGIKGKVGEAMAHGIPVVTTSIGAEGFGLTNEFDVMIADDPESFATAVQQLYSQKELWQRVVDNSRLRIEKDFTPEVIAKAINNSIKESFANQPAGASPPSRPSRLFDLLG